MAEATATAPISAARPFEVLVLNQLSARGLARLSAERYTTTKTSQQPDAVLVRSADMHGMPIPASVQAIARQKAHEGEPIPYLVFDSIIGQVV